MHGGLAFAAAQLKLIIRTLGTPTDEELGFISAPKAQAYIKALATVEVGKLTLDGLSVSRGVLPVAKGCRPPCSPPAPHTCGSGGSHVQQPRACLALPLHLCPFPPHLHPTRPAHAQRADLSKLFPGASPLAVDLLGRMLQFDPRRRISVQEALAHPWLAQLHDEAAEPAAPGGQPARRALPGRLQLAMPAALAGRVVPGCAT